jgi:thiamine biosynthesis lipoprotein
MAKAYSRRRAIAIFAAAAGLPLLTSARAAERPITWTGQALGAPATLILNHHDQAKANRLIERIVAEVARLEAVFSLYRDDSALSELNRTGVLIAPPADLVAVLATGRDISTMTGGAFDPTIQPLWALYRDHFSRPGADALGPSSQEIARALADVGFGRVLSDRDRIVLDNRMALTLNGIAQGYITDRIIDMLRDAGVTSSLVDMGEDRAIGARADGRPWRIGLAASEDSDRPDQVLDIIDKAVATSSADGFRFDDAGLFGHIIDPRTGAAPRLYRRVSVVADNAATADALSTAFTLMDQNAIAAAIRARPEVTVDLVHANGAHARFGKTIG